MQRIFAVPNSRFAVRFVNTGDLRHQRIIYGDKGRCVRWSCSGKAAAWHGIRTRVRIGEKRTNRKQDLGDSQRGAPLIFQDVKANATVRVDVWVVDAGGKGEFRGLEGVICGKIDVEEEHPAWKF